MSGQNGQSSARKTPQRARLPLLDRLLNSDPDAPETPAPSVAEAMEAFRASVRRDLEALLNARRRRLPLPTELGELVTSLINYGIPDPTSGSFAVDHLRAALIREIEATIIRFEPRLSNVKVTLHDDADRISRTLQMKVDAVLRADPTPEAISFETLLDPVTRDISVRET